VLPSAGHWDTQLGEFILKYDDVRTAQTPEKDILEFCQSTYEAGAKLAHWDRNALERRS
jgi:spore cortex formation protein SpoVR/YcgB (stage V sporulation)